MASLLMSLSCCLVFVSCGWQPTEAAQTTEEQYRRLRQRIRENKWDEARNLHQYLRVVRILSESSLEQVACFIPLVFSDQLIGLLPEFTSRLSQKGPRSQADDQQAGPHALILHLPQSLQWKFRIRGTKLRGNVFDTHRCEADLSPDFLVRRSGDTVNTD